ncbi:hypothetical protein BC830DRAFT_1083391 [Chytriomyces sp. MP71]|nr:hypothetical protein BC830DRAFT_1083391 [Chytriomyces sp. MP71]
MTCLPLANSTFCPSLQLYTGYIPDGLGITDIASFDEYMRHSIATAPSDAASNFGDIFRNPNVFNCPGWNGDGLRYLQSSLCAYFAGMAFQYGPPASWWSDAEEAGMCARFVKPVPLCRGTLRRFEESWVSVFADRRSCPVGENEAAQGLRGFITSVKDYLSANDNEGDAKCLVAESVAERNHCGFQTAAEGSRFCESADVEQEPCCGNANLQSMRSPSRSSSLPASSPRFICVQVD